MRRKKINKYFELAKRLSKKSDHYQYKMGCVIVKGKRVVGVGYNQLKSHPKSPHEWKTIHAEFHATLGTDLAELRGSTVYVYREKKNGDLANAMPCRSCRRMLESLGVKEVFYTIDAGTDGYCFY